MTSGIGILENAAARYDCSCHLGGPFVTRQKNGAAAAIGEAALSPNRLYVAVKGAEHQARTVAVERFSATCANERRLMRGAGTYANLGSSLLKDQLDLMGWWTFWPIRQMIFLMKSESLVSFDLVQTMGLLSERRMCFQRLAEKKIIASCG